MKSLLVTCTILLLVTYAFAYLPVLVMHGLNGQEAHYAKLLPHIREQHPGQLVIYLKTGYEGYYSIFNNLNVQLAALVDTINRVKAENNITSHHLLCHSQGALLCRTYLMTQDHSCVNYVSLAGVHMGEFGATEKLEKWLPFLHNVATHEVYRVAYTSILQAHISVANFWFDPFRHKQYLTSSEFLPKFNEHNETLSTEYRKNFLKLKKVIFTASPADDIIEPYQSSLFGMWNVTDTLYDYKMLDMKDQIIYQKDVFGLKTIQQDGRMQMFLVPDVLHMGWLSRTELCDKYMLPYLD